MESNSVIQKANNLVGIVSNMEQKCFCGEKIISTSLDATDDFGRVHLSCPNQTPGFHMVMIIEERRERKMRNLHEIGQDTCAQEPNTEKAN